VIPFSLLCKNPFMLSGSVYGIIVSDQRLAREAPPAPVPSAPPLAESELIPENSREVNIEPSPSAPLAGNSLAILLTLFMESRLSSPHQQCSRRYHQFHFLFENK
jgi:hypothetical protein